MSRNYDVIVIGQGAIGSAVAMHLAGRGASVLGIEQFRSPHARGSSHGESRVIRQAYFEDPAYVPLLKRAYTLWQELEQHRQKQLFIRCGLLQVGAVDGPVIAGIRRSANEHHLPVETLDAKLLAGDFSQFKIPSDLVALFESNAGYLLVEECVRAQIEQAMSHGASLLFDCPVVKWTSDAGHFTVQTVAGTYQTEKLVVTCGPWAAAWPPDYSSSLQVVLKHLYWYQRVDERFRRPECPVFLYELPHGVFYGVPATASGVKVAEHTGGIPIPHLPTDETPQPNPQARARVDQFALEFLDGVYPPTAESTCWYTMSPDSHFLIDESPTSPGLYFAAGLSGHGFKFAPVLGEILADLALFGSTKHPIAPFRVARFQADMGGFGRE